MIRRATPDDCAAIVDMAAKFYPQTDYAIKCGIPFDYITAIELTEKLTEEDLLLVADIEGTVVGMIGMAAGPFMFNKNYSGVYEVIWWVEPEYLGSGVGSQLLDEMERLAKEDHGATVIQMVKLRTSPAVAALLYEKRGYTHGESCYTKVV